MLDVWLTKDIFNWPIKNEGGTAGDARKTREPYRLLDVAAELLGAAEASNTAPDPIAYRHLKHAVQHRIALIERYYELSRFFAPNTPALDQLEATGLAKPVLSRHLRPLTEAAGSDGAQALGLERLKELLEITWYFLKATDGACTLVRTSLTQEQGFARDTNTPPLKFTAEVSPLHTQQLRIRGWFSPACFRLAPEEGFPLKMQVTHTHDRAPSVNGSGTILLSEQTGASQPDRWLDGIVEPSQERMLKFWRANFAHLG
jgi:DNA-binding transcriptional ArsR family regulator